MGIDKKLNPNWKQRIAEIGKNNFEVEEMIRLGFFEINESSQAKFDELAKEQNIISNCRIFPRQALHSKTLSFIHPIFKKKLNFDINLPDDIKNLINIIK